MSRPDQLRSERRVQLRPERCALVRVIGASFASLWLLACAAEPEPAIWSEAELALMRSLSLSSLPALPPSASNAMADDPNAAVFGQILFFDAGLSRDGSVNCVLCHEPRRAFADGLARGEGLGVGERNTPSIIGAAYRPWQFWDGRRDSLWSQALGPIEADAEMGNTRVDVARYVTSEFAEDYAGVFGESPDFSDAARFPSHTGPFGNAAAKARWEAMAPGDRRAVNMTFANVGKAIAAYERLLLPAPSRFDLYVDRIALGASETPENFLDADEIAGLALFLDAERTQCTRCHNGPLLSNHAFHRVGTGGETDFGRFLGMQAVQLDPFNCLGEFSDAGPEDCGELRFLARSHAREQMGAFKTPSLRDVSGTAPYMHDGRFATLEQVLAHYASPGELAGSELTPLALDADDVRQLIAFLGTLDGGTRAERKLRLSPRGALPPSPRDSGARD